MSILWSLYLAANHTKREICIGVAEENDGGENASNGRANGWPEHWDRDRDALTVVRLKEFETREVATAFRRVVASDRAFLEALCPEAARCPRYRLIDPTDP